MQLIAADSGDHLWARKFDQSLEALLDDSDNIVEQIVGGLTAQLMWAESDRSENAPPESLGPWEYCQRAATTIGRAMGGLAMMRRCVRELETALEIAPDYAPAHALRSWTSNAAIINGMYEDGEFQSHIDAAKYHLARARELAAEDLFTWTYIGAAENYAGMQQRAVETLERVLKKNPASAEAWYLICQAYSYLGRIEDASRAIDRASELAPDGGFAPLHNWYRGLVYYHAGDYAQAAPLIERKALESPHYGYVNIVAAFCMDHAGDSSKALRYIAKAKELCPELRPEKLKLMITAQWDREKGEREYTTLERLWNDVG